MLEIREKILTVIKERNWLSLTEDKALFYEVIEFKDNEFFYVGGNSLNNIEEFRYSLSPKQALAKICDYYRKKGNIEAVPGYKEIYKYMLENKD
jgi:hypothetical protein